MHKFMDDEFPQLMSIIDHPGWKVLKKVLDNMVEERLIDIVKYRIDDGNPQRVIWLKCRHEGAKRLVDELNTTVERVLKPSNE